MQLIDFSILAVFAVYGSARGLQQSKAAHEAQLEQANHVFNRGVGAGAASFYRKAAEAEEQCQGNECLQVVKEFLGKQNVPVPTVHVTKDDLKPDVHLSAKEAAIVKYYMESLHILQNAAVELLEANKKFFGPVQNGGCKPLSPSKVNTQKGQQYNGPTGFNVKFRAPKVHGIDDKRNTGDLAKDIVKKIQAQRTQLEQKKTIGKLDKNSKKLFNQMTDIFQNLNTEMANSVNELADEKTKAQKVEEGRITGLLTVARPHATHALPQIRYEYAPRGLSDDDEPDFVDGRPYEPSRQSIDRVDGEEEEPAEKGVAAE